jgi:hypothetical protein
VIRTHPGQGDAFVLCPIGDLSGVVGKVQLSLSSAVVQWPSKNGSGSGTIVAISTSADPLISRANIVDQAVVLSKAEGSAESAIGPGIIIRDLDAADARALIVKCRSAWKKSENVTCHFYDLVLEASGSH